MDDIYKQLYFKLFNDVSKAIEDLKKAQIKSEELFITYNENNIKQLEKKE